MVLSQRTDGSLEIGIKADDIVTQESIAVIAALAVVIPKDRIVELISCYTRLDTIGILDPSSYMRSGNLLRQRRDIADAFSRFHSAAQEFEKHVRNGG